MGDKKHSKKSKTRKNAEVTAEIKQTVEPKPDKLGTKFYEAELAKLQIELVKLQEWIKFKGLKVVALFEGRDAAGKGGVIKRITMSLNPRETSLSRAR